MAYAVLVLGAALIELAVGLPMGSLPLALHDDGAPDSLIAAVMGVGNIAALAGSVPIGALVDRIGRLPVIRAAALLSVVSLAVMAELHGPLANGIATALRSLGMTAFITAEFAYASALVRPERSVSAVATLGMVGNLSFALAPALGVWLWQHGVGREQYLYAGAIGLASVATLFVLPRRHDVRIKRSRRILMRSAWLPTVALLGAGTLIGGVNSALAVLTFHQRGIVNGALLFSAIAATTFALRYPAGRLVDRFGPRALVLPVAAIHATGALLAARAASVTAVIVAGVLLGIAWAAFVPVGIGLLFERSSKGTRGAAMGAYNLAFAGGNSAGAALATITATVPGWGYAAASGFAGIVPLLAAPWVLAQGAPGARGAEAGTSRPWTISRFIRASNSSLRKSTPSSTKAAR